MKRGRALKLAGFAPQRLIKLDGHIDKGACDGEEIAVFLVHHTKGMDQVIGVQIKESELLGVGGRGNPGFVEETEPIEVQSVSSLSLYSNSQEVS